MTDFGECDCGGKLLPIQIIEREKVVRDGVEVYTGRKRKVISHLMCEWCLKCYCVDEKFDEPWLHN